METTAEDGQLTSANELSCWGDSVILPAYQSLNNEIETEVLVIGAVATDQFFISWISACCFSSIYEQGNPQHSQNQARRPSLEVPAALVDCCLKLPVNGAASLHQL